MRAASFALGPMLALAAIAAGCDQSRGVHRFAEFSGAVEPSCLQDGVRAVPGVHRMETDPDRAHPNVTYQVSGITDALQDPNIYLSVLPLKDAGHFQLSHHFGGKVRVVISKAKEQDIVAVMQRVEDVVSSACDIDLVKKIPAATASKALENSGGKL